MFFSAKAKGNCSKLLNDFKESSNEFSTCILSLELDICTKCGPKFFEAEYMYSNLYKEKEDNITCKSLYIDTNRMNLVKNNFIYISKTWNAGSCNSKPHNIF